MQRWYRDHGGRLLDGRPAGGKTGSSENNATETFVGFTPQVAAAGIAVNVDDPKDFVQSYISSSVDIAVARTMATFLKGKPAMTFPVPSKKIAYSYKPTAGASPTPSPSPGAGGSPPAGTPGGNTPPSQPGRRGNPFPPPRQPNT